MRPSTGWSGATRRRTRAEKPLDRSPPHGIRGDQRHRQREQGQRSKARKAMIGTRHRATDPERETASASSVPPEPVLSAHEMGSCSSQLDWYAEALEAYEAAIRHNPADTLAYVGKGNMLLLLHRPAEALSAYTEAACLAPSCALAYAGQGMALRELGRYRAALDAYEQAIRWDPSFAPAHFGKGYVLLCLKRYWQAWKVYRHALRLEQGAA